MRPLTRSSHCKALLKLLCVMILVVLDIGNGTTRKLWTRSRTSTMNFYQLQREHSSFRYVNNWFFVPEIFVAVVGVVTHFLYKPSYEIILRDAAILWNELEALRYQEKMAKEARILWICDHLFLDSVRQGPVSNTSFGSWCGDRFHEYLDCEDRLSPSPLFLEDRHTIGCQVCPIAEGYCTEIKRRKNDKWRGFMDLMMVGFSEWYVVHIPPKFFVSTSLIAGKENDALKSEEDTKYSRHIKEDELERMRSSWELQAKVFITIEPQSDFTLWNINRSREAGVNGLHQAIFLGLKMSISLSLIGSRDLLKKRDLCKQFNAMSAYVQPNTETKSLNMIDSTNPHRGYTKHNYCFSQHQIYECYPRGTIYLQ